MTKLTRKLHPTESDLRKTEKWLEAKIARINEDLYSAIIMASNELLENAVKFHMDKGYSSSISFQLTIDETVEILVTNQFDNEEDLSTLIEQIDKIRSGEDPRDQYMFRLKEIMEERIQGESRLGLLRIASEGNFGIEYEINEKKLTVRAYKYYNIRKGSVMESLIKEDFAIFIVHMKKDDPVELVWRGRSRNLNPASVLDKYLDELLPNLLESEVIVNFTEMESLNSSSIPPILSFLKSLELKRVRTEVRYAGDVFWQKASFKPLSVLIRDFQFVKIRSVITAADSNG